MTRKTTKPKPIVVKEKTYIIVQRDYSDGSSTVERNNTGFFAAELLGHIRLTEREVYKQMDGLLNPEDVKKERKLIKKQ